MSSVVVATPLVTPAQLFAVGSGLAALGAAVQLARGVYVALDECVKAARAEAAARKEREAAWHRLREQVMASRDAEASAEVMQREVGRRLAAMVLGDATKALSVSKDVQAMDRPAWLALSLRGPAPDWSWEKALGEISAALSRLREQPVEIPDSVIQALNSRCDAMRRRAERGQPPDYDELRSFGQAVDMSVREAREAAQRQRAAFETFAGEAEALLDTLLYVEALAEQLTVLEDTARQELRALRLGLEEMLRAGKAKPGALELTKDWAKTLRAKVEGTAAQERYYAELVGSLERNLETLGYERLQAFPPALVAGSTLQTAVFAIPGGEQVRAAIDRHMRLSFEVVHVRAAGQSEATPLSAEEQLLFFRQETKWCADAHELLRCLAAEGFPFEIRLEKGAEAESVRVVVVDSAVELVEKNAEEEAESRARRQVRLDE